MKDVFKNKDFIEYFIYKNNQYECIVSPIVAEQIQFTQYGTQSGENFTLDVKLPLFDQIKANEKITFRNKKYKIQHIEIDSANASVKIYLIALSKAI